MPHGSAWQREKLALKQIPTLQTLLRCCDERLLMRVIIDEHVARADDWEALSPKRRRSVEKRLAASLSTMGSLAADKKRKRSSLLLPSESFVLHARSGLVERRMSAALMSLDDAPVARNALEARASDGVSPPAEAVGPNPRCYTLAPWEETLAQRVWLGELRCCRERYLVLAAAFWEMTYFGFEYERVCARQSERKTRRMLEELGEGSSSESAASSSRVKSCATPIALERQHQAIAFGLVEPDRFECDYRDGLAERVAELNRACDQALWARLVDVARRLGKT